MPQSWQEQQESFAPAAVSSTWAITSDLSDSYRDINDVRQLESAPTTHLLSAAFNLNLPREVRQVSVDYLEAEMSTTGMLTLDALSLEPIDLPSSASPGLRPAIGDSEDEMEDDAAQLIGEVLGHEEFSTLGHSQVTVAAASLTLPAQQPSAAAADEAGIFTAPSSSPADVFQTLANEVSDASDAEAEDDASTSIQARTLTASTSATTATGPSVVAVASSRTYPSEWTQPNAAKLVTFSQPHRIFYHEDMSKRCVRDYDVVVQHPSYQDLFRYWRNDLVAVLQLAYSNGADFDQIAAIYAHYDRDPRFIELLIDAWEESSRAVVSFAPVTANLGRPSKGGTFSSKDEWPVYVQWWCGFSAQFNKTEGRAIWNEIVGRETTSRSGGLRYLRRVERPGTTQQAIRDAHDLGARVQLFQIAGQNTVQGYLPPLIDRDSNRIVLDLKAEQRSIGVQEAEQVVQLEHDLLIKPLIDFSETLESKFKYRSSLAKLTELQRPSTDNLGSRNAVAIYQRLGSYNAGIISVEFSVSDEEIGQLGALNLDSTLLRKTQDSSAPFGASQGLAHEAQKALEQEMPGVPALSLEEKGQHLKAYLHSIKEDSEDLQRITRYLVRDSSSLTAGNASYGTSFSLRSMLDSIYLSKLLLNRGIKRKIYSEDNAAAIYKFFLTTIAIAALSPRPVIFGDIFNTFLSSFDNDRSVANVDLGFKYDGDLVLLYSYSLLGMVLLTDKDHRTPAPNSPLQDRVRLYACLFDASTHAMTCRSCGVGPMVKPSTMPSNERKAQTDLGRL
ncbi:hypothetical protein JCM10296v2_002981 [Rhodotorula toruloides]